MGRVIQDNLKKPLANELLFGSLVDGGQVTVSLDSDKNTLTYDFQSAPKHKPGSGPLRRYLQCKKTGQGPVFLLTAEMKRPGIIPAFSI